MMMRYNFTRTRNGVLMAEGVAVHASSPEAAVRKAQTMIGKGEYLLYAGRSTCVGHCTICEGKESNES